MLIKPIPEEQASPQVKECYSQIKKALSSLQLPLFFTYFGAFPEYLSYITKQLISNLQEPSFHKLTVQLNQEIISQIAQVLGKSESTLDFIRLHKIILLFIISNRI